MSNPCPSPEGSLYEPLGRQGSRDFRLLQVELEKPPLPVSGTQRILARARGHLDDFAETWLPSSYYYSYSSLRQCAITCRLSTHSLDAAPPYRALSYTWGDTTDTEPIQVNGHTVEVTKSLLAALRRIARDAANDPGGAELQPQQLLLWADALCINQQDEDEKKQQIPMMSDIYGRAGLVYLWLGEEQSHTSRALSFVRASLRCQLFLQQQAAAAAPRSDYESYALRLASSLDSASAAAAMQEFFGRAYWGRVWVLQEVAYASNAVVICGRYKLPFSELCWASYFWRFVLGSSFTPKGSTIFWNYGLERFDMFREVALGYSARSQNDYQVLLAAHGDAASRALLDIYMPRNENLFDLFIATSLFKATDPRDRFYALLNLLPAEKRLIEPDYRVSTAACHHKIVVQGITQYKSLDCISLGGVGVYCGKSGTARPNIPSWVPDFSSLGGGHGDVLSVPVCMMRFGNNRIRASLEKPPKYSFSRDATVLTLEGFQCDAMSEVLSSELRLEEGYQWCLRIMESLGLTKIRSERRNRGQGETNLYQRLLSAFQPEEFAGEDFFRTALPEGLLSEESVGQNLSILASGFMLLAGFASRHSYAQHWMDGMRSYEALLQAAISEGDPALSYLVLSRCTQYLTRSTTARALERQAYEQVRAAFQRDGVPSRAELIPWHESASSTWRKSVTPDMSVQQFWHSVFKYWRGRKLVVTDRGYLGFARPGTQAGDGVYILHGCRTPLVLRATESGEHKQHVLVGDAYFYGMMKGEMVDRREDGEELFPLENITLA